MAQTMNTEAQHELTERTTLRPMKLRTYKSAFEGQEPLTALNIPGKTVDGRNWTSYIEDEKGVEVLQVSGGSYEEASSIAGSILRAVNSHDALVEALRLVVTRYDIKRDFHWQQLGLPRPQDDDNDTIRTARAALAAAQETK